MVMIKKKTAVRGTEGGVKYFCDSCSADITSTVRLLALNLSLSVLTAEARFVSAVQMPQYVPITTIALLASPRERQRASMILELIPIKSLNSIRYPYFNRTGVLTKNFSYWKGLRLMGWGRGQILPIT